MRALHQIEPRRLGFTLMELLVVVAMIAVLASIGVISFGRMSRRELSREAGRRMVTLAHEARSSAILLGTARGTPRTTLDASCPPEFSLSGGSDLGTGGLLVQPESMTCPPGSQAPCDLVTYVKRVERVPGPPTTWAGDQYVLRCDTIDLRDLAQDAARMVAVDMEGTPGRFVIHYDDRGLIQNMGPRSAARVTFAETDAMHGNTPSVIQTVLILGSGLPCHEGQEAYECAKN